MFVSTIQNSSVQLSYALHTYMTVYTLHTSYPSKLIERPHVEFGVVIFEPKLPFIEESQGSHLSTVEYQRTPIGNIPDYKLIRLLDVKSNTQKKKEMSMMMMMMMMMMML